MFTAPQELQIWLKERRPHTLKDLTEMADTYQLADKQSSRQQQQEYSTTVNINASSVAGLPKFSQSVNQK